MNIINDGFELVPVGQLREHPKNPNEGDCGAIHESIEENGFSGAIIAQRSTGYVLSGNHTFRTVVQQGAPEIPTHWVDCDDDRAMRILLSHNRARDLASYNEPMLAEVLKEIVAESGNLEGTLYTREALDNILNDIGELGGGEKKAIEFEAAEKIDILITCKSKRQQTQLLKRFEKEGLQCRAA